MLPYVTFPLRYCDSIISVLISLSTHPPKMAVKALLDGCVLISLSTHLSKMALKALLDGCVLISPSTHPSKVPLRWVCTD